MLRRVISGGQTGADLAGLRAARKVGLETGGTAPKGYLTERGPRPIKLKFYGLVESTSDKYPPRTAKNIADSDMTLVIANNFDGGSKLTVEMCFKQKKPVMHIHTSDLTSEKGLEEVLGWLLKKKHDVINIAGNRESKSPGIEKVAELFLRSLFRSIIGYDKNFRGERSHD
jgi:Circularly permutated YpsA SLOG family